MGNKLTRKANATATAWPAVCVFSSNGLGVVKSIFCRQKRKMTVMAWKMYHCETPLMCLVKPLNIWTKRGFHHTPKIVATRLHPSSRSADGSLSSSGPHVFNSRKVDRLSSTPAQTKYCKSKPCTTTTCHTSCSKCPEIQNHLPAASNTSSEPRVVVLPLALALRSSMRRNRSVFAV